MENRLSRSRGSTSSNEGETKKCFVKLVVIGDSGVGKSSLIHFFQKGQFSSHFKPTIGADFHSKRLEIVDNGETKAVTL